MFLKLWIRGAYRGFAVVIAGLKNDEAFLSLKAISDDRYAAAVSKSKQPVADGNRSKRPAGCDMLLRAVAFSSAGCDLLILQSPWIPILQDHSEGVVRAILQKNIKLRLFCGAEDEDCLPMAKQLYTVARQSGYCCLGAVISTFGTPVASCHIVF